MKRVRNDPTSYVKRSDLGPKHRDGAIDKRAPRNVQREKDYLIAPIDDAGYIDFGVPAKKRNQT